MGQIKFQINLNASFKSKLNFMNCENWNDKLTNVQVLMIEDGNAFKIPNFSSLVILIFMIFHFAISAARYALCINNKH